MITELKFRQLVENERKKVEKILGRALINRSPKSLYSPADYILQSPGKRLRPLLVLLSVKAVGGKFEQAYNAAAAVEMLHNFTLVHDDIMDNADKRRGRLTIHKKYDLSTAILVGDALLAVAFEYLLKDCKCDSKEMIAAFNHSLLEVCEGQSMDKDFELQKNVIMSEYILMIEKKTAALAEMCCKIGALIGNGSEKEIKALSSYGKNIGLAFQIQDDLLDITGNEQEFGKAIGGDLMEGKKTFLFIKALEKADRKSKTLLAKVIKNKGIKQEEVELYKNLYLKLGVVEDAQSEIINYTDKALSGLKYIKNAESKELLTILADQLIKRSK